MNLTEKFLTELSNDKGKNYTLKQLFGKFNAYTSFEKDVIVKVVDELTTDGKLVFDSKKRLYTLVDESKFLRGTIDGNPRGFAFFINDEGDTPDLFIAPANLKGALHKDKVLAVKIEGSRDEGRVVSILERGIKEVVGVYQKTATRFVVPDDKKFCKDIYIEQRKDKNAKNGQKVVARITSYPEGDKKPEGEI
ncbi:MAG: ribonuclease R, partial [Clostridia bacterium]